MTGQLAGHNRGRAVNVIRATDRSQTHRRVLRAGRASRFLIRHPDRSDHQMQRRTRGRATGGLKRNGNATTRNASMRRRLYAERRRELTFPLKIESTTADHRSSTSFLQRPGRRRRADGVDLPNCRSSSTAQRDRPIVFQSRLRETRRIPHHRAGRTLWYTMVHVMAARVTVLACAQSCCVTDTEWMNDAPFYKSESANDRLAVI